MVCVKIAGDCGQTKMTLYFIALLLNIILCYIFFRRDHIQEEQSLRICQGHPNIVKLQEVFQDAVSALCKVLQSRILILYNLLEALPMYKEFVIIMYSPSLYDWRVGLSLLFFLEMDNFLGPWLIAYSAMLIQCFSTFHFLSRQAAGEGNTQLRNEKQILSVLKKDKMADRTTWRLCMSHLLSVGPIFVGRGRVISGCLANRFGSRFGTNTKLFCRVIGPISMPNDYLSTVIEWCC